MGCQRSLHSSGNQKDANIQTYSRTIFIIELFYFFFNLGNVCVKLFLDKFFIGLHLKGYAQQAITNECTNTLNVLLWVFDEQFNMFCFVKAHRFYRHSNALAKMSKCFHILKSKQTIKAACYLRKSLCW